MNPPQIAGATAPATVYRAYDDAGTLLYVGCAVNVEKRMAQHRRTAAWYADMARTETVEYPSRGLALAAEAEAIRAEHPAYNVSGYDGYRRGCACPRCVDYGAAVERIVSAAPELTPAQRDRLAVIFAGTSQEVTQR